MSLKKRLEKLPSFYSWTIDETLHFLATSEDGLKLSEANKRQLEFGKNVIHEVKISLWRILLRQFHNVFIYILIAAAAISISIGEWTDSLLIGFLIVVNAIIGFWQELKAHSSIAALKKMTESHNKVMRGGELVWLSSCELVPGDYLIFHEGEVVTADIRLVSSAGLMVDESAITGESQPVIKNHEVILKADALPYELNNTLLAGTTIVRGSGAGVVVKTAGDTYLASIAQESQEESPETPLTKALRFFAQRYVIVLIVFFAILGTLGYLQGRNAADLAYILLASLVSAVPEGLPIVVTLVMVIGAISLSRGQVFVRYLPSVETLGSTTVIASDKTGTITTGKLQVKDYFTSDLTMLQRIAVLCNDAHKEGVGDPLDMALLDWVDDTEKLREEFPRKWAYSFDSDLMLMATVNEIDGKELLLVKGAYESLKEKGSSLSNWQLLDKEMNKLLNQGLRVLAFGKTSAVEKDPQLWEVEIVGLIGFLDPPKEGVREAVQSAQKAGIRVIMLTGDHPTTAQAVAKQVNIWKDGDPILTGHEVEALSDKELTTALKKATVLARILPEHKYRVVKLLQKQKEVVAVTGDGVNDVPALKAADLGIAMGNGTEAAKNVAKIVITDNNFRFIVKGISNARVISDNIRKLIYYLISISFLEVFFIFFVIAGSFPLPLAAVQVLWINIVAGGVQDKIFVFVKAEGNVMLRRPRPSKKQFFDTKQLVSILTFGLALGIAMFCLYLYLLPIYPFRTVSTLIFTSIVAAQLANGIQSQKEEEPFFKNIKRSFSINPYLFIALVSGVLLQCFALYLVPSWFHVEYLPLVLWKYPLLLFCIAFFFVEMKKWVEYAIRKYKRYQMQQVK